VLAINAKPDTAKTLLTRGIERIVSAVTGIDGYLCNCAPSR
jgi:hypothetical protein